MKLVDFDYRQLSYSDKYDMAERFFSNLKRTIRSSFISVDLRRMYDSGCSQPLVKKPFFSFEF